MSEFRVISSIMRGRWLLAQSWVESHLPMIGNVLEGQKFSYYDDDDDRRESKKNMASADGLAPYSFYSGFDKAPKGSIAQIDMIGPVMHYGWCDDGTYELARQVREANANANIIGIMLNIDSPGGEVDGTEALEKEILRSAKPVVGFVNNGLMASAAMWVGSAAMELYADSSLSMVGSVGVYTTLYDYKEFFESKGIKVSHFYAPQSTDKNKTYRDALEGKDAALKAELSFIADEFIKTIKTNRGHALTSEDWTTGKMYYGEEAKNIGLIDDIMSRSAVIDRIRSLSSGTTPLRTQSSNNNIHMKFPNIEALAGNENISQEDLDKANGDLTEAGITGHTIVAESLIADAAQATTDLNTANERIVTLETDLAAAQQKATDLEASNKTLKNVIATRSKESSGPAISKESGKETEIDEDEKDKAPLSAHQKWADELLN